MSIPGKYRRAMSLFLEKHPINPYNFTKPSFENRLGKLSAAHKIQMENFLVQPVYGVFKYSTKWNEKPEYKIAQIYDEPRKLEPLWELHWSEKFISLTCLGFNQYSLDSRGDSIILKEV